MAGRAGTFLFGVSDGLLSVVGLVIGMLATSSGPTITKAAVGLAVASGVGMAAGEMFESSENGWRECAVMGGATMAGTLAPIVPFLILAKPSAVIVGGLIGVAICGLVAEYRARHDDQRARAYLVTFGVFAAALAVTVLAALVTGAAG